MALAGDQAGDQTTAEPGYGNFDPVCCLTACELVPVYKYQSRVTGLTVLVAQMEGPIINGYFVLATEAHDDDGLPHTLEHLVFLGSEQYPYKGVLEYLTNSCLASSTNAWTDNDHTCYTLTAVSVKGFLSIIPVYLDHILYPTLTDTGFITEVHHINGDGDDAGTVYCEMQSREDLGEPMLQLALLQSLYPGKGGYSYEPGGMLKNLRESTDNEKVRSYHKQFYRPENLTVIVTGPVETQDLLKSLSRVEERIVSKGDRGDFCRPMKDPILPLEESQDLEVVYPCEDEEHGMVYVGWRGPSIVTDMYTMQACSMFLKFLTEAAESPLRKEFVTCDDPCARNIDFNTFENTDCVLYLHFEKVPIDKLDKIQPRLTELLKEMDHLDMDRLRSVVHQNILDLYNSLENSPHETIASFLIVDSIYGRSKESLEQHVNAVNTLTAMENEPESFWLNLLQTHMVDAAHVTIRGKPSCEKLQQLVGDERTRLEEQRARIGEEGLKELGVQLMNAMEKNNEDPPEEMLKSLENTLSDCINFYYSEKFTTLSEKQHPKFDLAHAPVTMHLDDVRSSFVYIHVLIDTSGISVDQRAYLPLFLETLLEMPVKRGDVLVDVLVDVHTSGISVDQRAYLPLFLETLLEMPVKRGDVLVDHDDVAAELRADVVCVGSVVGLEPSDRFTCGPYTHTACVLMQLEPAKYDRAVVWLRELIHQSEVTVDRLRAIATIIMEEADQIKRQGHRVVGDLMKILCFSRESNYHAVTTLRQHTFLAAMLEKLDTEEGSKQVLSDLEALRSVLTDPSCMAIHMAADVDRLVRMHDNPAAMWSELLPQDVPPARNPLVVTPDWKLLNPETESPYPNCIVGLEGETSSFFSQTCRCINDFNDPDLPALLVFLQYITQLEGPMWRNILGNGLACLYQIMPRPNEGLLHMGLYWATDCVSAYQITKGIFEAHCEDSVEWDTSLFEWARRSLVYEVIQREKCVGDLITQSLLSFFKDIDYDYKRRLMVDIVKVETADLVRVGKKYTKDLFDPTKVKTAVVCNPSKSAEIAEALEKMDHKLTIFSSPEESFLSQ